MKKLTALLIGVFILCGGLAVAVAQDSEATMPPPKVLTVFREFVKPGKVGTIHEKSESAFVQAMAAAKWPTHYLGMDSVSGKQRSLFLTGYDSFDALEKDTKAVGKNATLSAALDRASAADGELLTESDNYVLMYREDQSLNANVDIPHMRYFEISVYQVRPGHMNDWNEAVKLVMAAYEKIPDVHWAMYQEVYGQVDTEFVVFTPLKSAAEIDQGFTRDKEFMANMGEDGMKKLAELEAAGIESVQHNLFAFNPKESYVGEDWIKADPDFWKPKSSMPMHMKKKMEEKPSGSQ
ncbi:MAG TPA: hypothetical protein VLV49_12210 [Terriglobales bacterium]|nr:hypothetical protein [Terriglobales bacterium]